MAAIPNASEVAPSAWERDRQIVLAHLQNLMLALRSNTKFSSKARLVHAPRAIEHPLTLSVQELRDRLCDPLLSHLPLRSSELLKPFVDVARSHESTEPITGVALAAFVAFLELKVEFINTSDLVAMSRCARDSRSEVMDPQSHEAIVARILQVFVGCVRHPRGAALHEDSVVEMLESAFAIATQANPNTSELLRRTAEQAMNDIVSAVYGNVARLPSDTLRGSYPSVLCYIARLIARDASLRGHPMPALSPTVQLQGLCLAHTALFVVQDALTDPACRPLLSCVCNDLARAMLRVGRHSDNVVVLAQMLRTMHLLVSFASSMVVPQLLSFLKAVHFQQLPSTDMHDLDRRERDELLFESLLEFSADPAFPAFLFYHYDLSLEYAPVLEQFCTFLSDACRQSPMAGSPVSEMMKDVVRPITQTNILALDCLLAMISSLARRLRTFDVVPPPAEIATLLAKKSLLLKFSSLLADSPKKAMKLLLREDDPTSPDYFGLGPKPGPAAIALFLARHGMLIEKGGLADYLSDLGKGPPQPDEKDVEARAKWNADRAAETEVIGTIGYHQKLLAEFLKHVHFRGRPLVASIREIVSAMGMPRESQKIDRVMEAFAKEWHHVNTDAPKSINPFLGSDAAFILSFSTMMLNTDIHSGKMEKTLTWDNFRGMNRGIDVGGASLPDEYLQAIYDEVKANKIELIDVVQKGFDHDDAWQQEMNDSHDILASHGKAISLRRGDRFALASYDGPVFRIIWRPAASAFSAILDASGANLIAPPLAESVDAMEAALPPRDLHVLEAALEGLRGCAYAAHRLGDGAAVDNVVSMLLRFLPLKLRDAFTHVQMFGRSPKCLLVCRLVFAVVDECAETMGQSWGDVGGCVAHMLLLGVFAEDDVGSPVSMLRPTSSFPNIASATTASPQPAGAATASNQQDAPASPGGPVSSSSDAPPMVVSTAPSTPQLPRRVLPAALVTNPRIAMPPANAGNEGGWFSLFGGGGSATRRRERDLEDHSALLRVRSACPDLLTVLQLSTRMPPSALKDFIHGIIAVAATNNSAAPSGAAMKPAGGTTGTVPAPATAGDAYVASFIVQLVVEVTVLNADRLASFVGTIAEYMSVLLGTVLEKTRQPVANNEAAAAAAAHWKDAWTRCLSAAHRLTVHLAQQPDVDPHATLVVLSAIAHILPPKVGSELAAPMSLALQHLAVNRGVQLRPAEWDQLLRLLVCAGRDAPSAQVHDRAGKVVAGIAQEGRYHMPENVAAVAEALAAFAIAGRGDLPSDDTVWHRITSTVADGTADARSPLLEPRSVPAGDFVEVFGDAVMSVHSRLVSAAPPAADTAATAAWIAAWRRLLHCVAAVCFGTTASAPKVCSDSLLLLQRCILDPRLSSALSPQAAHDLFHTVVLPLVEKVCLPSGSAAAAGGAKGTHAAAGHHAQVHHSLLAAVLSPSMLIQAVFGPLAGPAASPPLRGQQAAAAAAAASSGTVHFPDDMQSRTASMLPKAVLHLLPQLAADHRLFMPLWQRVLALLYALHTAPHDAKDHGLLREAVQESARNLVLVLATMAQQPEHELLFAPFPAFWPTTRQLIKSFDFAAPLVEQLDALGLTGETR
jgi:hypothetical protein